MNEIEFAPVFGRMIAVVRKPDGDVTAEVLSAEDWACIVKCCE